jgi:hypothetical protein
MANMRMARPISISSACPSVPSTVPTATSLSALSGW